MRLLLLALLPPLLLRAETPRVLDLDTVPSGFPVGFALLSSSNRQYAAYYDADRNMTVAARAWSDTTWHRRTLPSRIGWDSHNDVTLALDGAGHLHVAGNMHNVPLIYFRTSRAGDIDSLERVPAMTGDREARCTYPVFFRGPGDRLLFTYRDGSSGNGAQLVNVYDEATRAWRRLIDRPLADGQGRMSAYFTPFVRSPDGWFHLGWVWRDTPDCATNHDPSVARSRDLVTWETVGGARLELPFTPETQGVVIDPVPAGGGVINGGLALGLDSRGGLVVSYHKHDEAGNTQAFAARWHDGVWHRARVSDWKHRWEFSGGGTIVFDLRIGAIEPAGRGRLALPFRHITHGSGRFLLDETTLAPVGQDKVPSPLPPSFGKVESSVPGMQVRREEDLGTAPDGTYVLRWETLPANRDRPREGAEPPPSPLRVWKFK